MVSIEDLNESYQKVEDLKQNTYVLATKKLVAAAGRGNWTDLTDAQKKIAAKNYTNKINEEAIKLAGGSIREHNEFTPILLNPGEFTKEHHELITKDVSTAASIYTNSMDDLTKKLTMGVYNKIEDGGNIEPIANELAGVLDVTSGKIKKPEDAFKLWQFNYNRLKKIEQDNKLLDQYR